MLPAHLAARLLEQRRAEQSAEFARQLPLYADVAPLSLDPETDGPLPRREPDWTTDY